MALCDQTALNYWFRANRPEFVFHAAGTVEFLHVNDLADACVFLIHRCAEDRHINVGVGHDLSIAALAGLVKTVARHYRPRRVSTSATRGRARRQAPSASAPATTSNSINVKPD